MSQRGGHRGPRRGSRPRHPEGRGPRPGRRSPARAGSTGSPGARRPQEARRRDASSGHATRRQGPGQGARTVHGAARPGRLTIDPDSTSGGSHRPNSMPATPWRRVGARNSAHPTRPADTRGSVRRVVGRCRPRPGCGGGGVVGERPGGERGAADARTLAGMAGRPGRTGGVVQRRVRSCRCQRRMVEGVTISPRRRRAGGSRARAAVSARSAQDICGRGVPVGSTAS